MGSSSTLERVRAALFAASLTLAACVSFRESAADGAQVVGNQGSLSVSAAVDFRIIVPQSIALSVIPPTESGGGASGDPSEYLSAQPARLQAVGNSGVLHVAGGTGTALAVDRAELTRTLATHLRFASDAGVRTHLGGTPGRPLLYTVSSP